MSYYSEHRRFSPVLEKARELDIGKNPAPEAIFDPLSCGFSIWCTPDDRPSDDWLELPFIEGAFTKGCEYVATALWEWNSNEADPRIVAVRVCTRAYAPRDRDQGSPDHYENRPEDLAWAIDKVCWLFEQAGVSCPEILAGSKDKEN